MVLLHRFFLLSVRLPHEAEVEAVLKVIFIKPFLLAKIQIILESVDCSDETNADSLGSESIQLSTSCLILILPCSYSGLVCLSQSLLNLGRLRNLLLKSILIILLSLINLILTRKINVYLVQIYILFVLTILFKLLFLLLTKLSLLDNEIILNIFLRVLILRDLLLDELVFLDDIPLGQQFLLAQM